MGGGSVGTVTDPDLAVVLGRDPGPVVELLATGATVHRLVVTCGDGVRRDVVLGHPTVAERVTTRDYLGATIGRYANRIAGGHLELDGVTHQLAAHDRGNLLHGGHTGFDRRTWSLVDSEELRARWRLVSSDGDQGFPGELTAEIAFEVLDDGLAMTMTATTDAPTVVNLTHHGYANLDGSSTIDGHRLTVPADAYTPVDETLIPTGGHAPVDRTRFDLRAGVLLGEVGALDHNLVVRGSGMRTMAALDAPGSRTRLEVRSAQPGLQVYTGEALGRPRAGVALEPQLFPDSPHHPDWPSPVLRPGETYRHALEWRFSTLPVS